LAWDGQTRHHPDLGKAKVDHFQPAGPKRETTPGIDATLLREHRLEMQTTVNFKIGNEKLVKVMQNASSHLRGLLDRQGRPDGALRIAVIGGGCSGLQYKMDLVDGPRDRDILVPSNGVNVVIDPKSALFVSGSELDFSDDLQQGGFKVSNPNAIVTCSCGESFAA
jgi:iron-sulfur cluster assembly accessory protein